MCNLVFGDTMKISSRYHGLLIYDIERTTKIDGMGPFKAPVNNDVSCMINDFELV